MSESDETDLIVVLGMHRSGTSAITRGIRVLGADFGDNLQPAVAGINEKGFFEDNDIVALNERLLKTLSIEWHTLRYLDKNEFNDASLNELKEKARILLKEKLTGSGGLLCVKDPRFSILLPFWKLT